ncbi:SapC family protein [Rhodanobacter sp. DHG33]|uniref:SapC family protein n=1 Tax=Rhodanobacter sp. DHG33 TaxID=2775921 RepID=UPI001783A688|nr:SapC family protein [Rhodanobacter sp. DHG33]
MAEVLFYERPVPLNRTAHKDLRLKPIPNMKFALDVHSVPLTGVEFGLAARDMPIVFAGNDMASAGPVALLGLRQNENLFVNVDGQWREDAYVPAFVRRYPFVLAEKPVGQEGDDFAVFLDEGYEGFNTDEGDRLFNEDGTDTEMLSRAVGFLGEFQQHVARTRWFMDQLRKHDLLEPRNISMRKGTPDGQGGNVINLNGLYVVNEEKLRQLDEKTAQEFLREGVAGWIYAHLISMNNLDRLGQRLGEREEGETGAVRN